MVIQVMTDKGVMPLNVKDGRRKKAEAIEFCKNLGVKYLGWYR